MASSFSVWHGSPWGRAMFFLLTLGVGLSVAGAGSMSLPPSSTNSWPPHMGIFAKGEELTYEVSYMSVKLGRIVTRVTAVDSGRQGLRIKTESLIKSYKGVPFVTLSVIFQSTIDRDCASTSFLTREWQQDTTHKYINYTFPPGKDLVYISEREGNTPIWEKWDTLRLDGKRWQDGLSLLYYARAKAYHARHSEYVPVLMYRSKATTTINFGLPGEWVEIDAVKYPVAAYALDGETGFTGIFGLTGGFEGWFSHDAAAVPLKAKMHVIIGSVKLELIQWKREGWSPPRSF